jgi:hypothetical protein
MGISGRIRPLRNSVQSVQQSNRQARMLIMNEVISWSFERKLEETLRRTMPKLAPEARDALAAFITPESLSVIAGVLLLWIVSHAFGVGEAIDLILAVVGFTAVGMSIFSGLDHFGEFASSSYNAKSDRDFDAAAEHLSKCITILGITTVLALLFRGRPATGRGGKIAIGSPPLRMPGMRYKPTVTKSASLRAGEGSTSVWGDIEVSTRGSASEQKLVLLHEKIHQFLTPRLYPLRNFRIENRTTSYFRSSLSRYLEEALAEMVAQVSVNGIKNFFVAIRFPVQSGYVYLTRGGGFNPLMSGAGIVPEGAALLSSGMMAGSTVNMCFSPR